MTRAEHLAQRFVIGILFATMLVRVALIASDWSFGDVDAYWQAALRLRSGQPLYLPGVDPDSYQVFRYAPWFAWLWVPLSYLPQTVVEWAWAGVLAAASITILVGLARLRRPGAWALALIITPWLLSLVQVGNIQPLVVAMLAFGISRPSGPVWVGIAASLKLAPLAFALVYLARREWLRLASSVVVAAILVAPVLFYDPSGYTTDPGRSFSFYYYVSPAAWLVAAAASAVVALVLAVRRSPYVWVAAALAVMLLPPRTHVTYATFLVVGLLGGLRDRIDGRNDRD
jgi:alpha-1,2-mannosyltransferase